jgi:hypothetical protein
MNRRAGETRGRQRGRSALGRLLWVGALAGLLACSGSSDDDAPANGAGGGAGTASGGSGGDAGASAAGASGSSATGMVTHSGTVVDFSNLAPIKDGAVAQVTLAPGSEGTTDANGGFAIQVPSGVMYSPTITAPGYIEVSFGAMTLSGDFDQGRYTLSSLQHAVLARKVLGDYDPTKGVILVAIGRLSTCADIEGTTIAVDPPGQAHVRYFRNRMQSAATSAGSGEDPAALVWNVDPDVPISVVLTSPTCAQAKAPVTDGPVTYEGTVTARPGGELSGQLYTSFFRAYLE